MEKMEVSLHCRGVFTRVVLQLGRIYLYLIKNINIKINLYVDNLKIFKIPSIYISTLLFFFYLAQGVYPNSIY